METKFVVENDHYGTDTTPVTFGELQRQFAHVFPEVEIENHEHKPHPGIYTADGELVAVPLLPGSTRINQDQRDRIESGPWDNQNEAEENLIRLLNNFFKPA